MCTAWYGWYIPVCQLIDMQTTRYRAVPPIGVVSAPRRGRRKPGVIGVALHPHDPSPVGDFFFPQNVSPRGEKERGDIAHF
ncbi:hypothetical protein BHM03_00039858 [Ensete ventricosum]|nr:hypothetical protein BHM03_00039858 [Ensete ventricosum]